MQKWIKDAQSLDKIASDSDLLAKKVCAKEIFGSHLRLGQKSVQVGEPETLAKSGGNAWAALRTAHASVGSEPLSSILVPKGRFELPRP
ncbi:MAG TPA: hypothetical protein VJI73_02900 [Candidatus Paceibacterota bacterium]